MPVPVIRHGIFVASTNDLIDERRAAVEAMVEWNEQNWDEGIVFTPLMWESGAVGDARAARPQDAITGQLLEKASGLVALFKHRLGTATGGSISGTCEEIDEALRRDGFPTALFFSTAPVPKELLDERQALEKWKQGFNPGLSIEFDNTGELKRKILAQLHDWSRQLRSYEGATGLVEERLDPEDYQTWLNTHNPARIPCTLLLYNVELETFRTSDEFARYWNNLHDEPQVEKVVLLLQSYKLRRLKDYLKDWNTTDVLESLKERFFVCPISASQGERPKIASSTAFCLMRTGTDPRRGEPIPGARVFTLSEPFSVPSGRVRAPEVVWQYKHSFIAENEGVLRSLVEIWDDSYTAERQFALTDINDTETPIDQPVIHVDPARGPGGGDDLLGTIRALRERLFDPNVPSYLLDENYYILDWNPAFEMVFPTQTFYRREHVKEFVQQLDNRDDVTRKGEKFERGEIAEWFDMEPLYYCSPRYRNMEFNKMASRVDNPVSGSSIGWIVALHVKSVEAVDLYEDDLRVVNEANSLTTVYARPYQHILSSFPPYIDLIDRHLQALAECTQVIDGGCGIGMLARRLVEADKSVTAVDNNDQMLVIARETMRPLKRSQLRRLSLVKANVETLHSPNIDYNIEKIGIRQKYDGLALLNSYHVLSDPLTTLTRIRRELLRDGAKLAMSLPAPDSDLDILLGAIQKHGNEFRDRTGHMPWTGLEYEVLARVNRQLAKLGLLTRHSSGYAATLEQAGFEVESAGECYLGQGLFVVARAA